MAGGQECPCCGGPVPQHTGPGRSRKWCSETCYRSAQEDKRSGPKRWHVCWWCLASFERRGCGSHRQYCSTVCARTAQHARGSNGDGYWINRNARARPVIVKAERVCETCGVAIPPNGRTAKWCPACRPAAKAAIRRGYHFVYEAKRGKQVRPCLCGCGRLTTRASGWFNGHRPPPEPRFQGVPCLCGCGELTRASTGYRTDHVSRYSRQPRVPCLCGCGDTTARTDGYRLGHNPDPRCPQGHPRSVEGQYKGACRECYRRMRRRAKWAARDAERTKAAALDTVLEQRGLDPVGGNISQRAQVWDELIAQGVLA